jgi:peroxiredoxin
MMVRNRYWTLLWCAVLAGAVGCGSSEQQGPAPAEQSAQVVDAEAKPQADGDVDAEPQAAVRDEAVKLAAAEEPVKEGEPQQWTAFFRLDASAPAVIPPVVLSKRHEALCKVKLGDVLPAIEVPPLGTSQKKKLAELYGKKATVVVFWKGDRRMAREVLADVGPDVVELFGKQGVAVVGIAVNETAASAKAALDKAGAKFVNLLDADGKAFALVGSVRLPRVYLVDPAGKILWFDIEYSQTTRRELHQALRAVTVAPPESPTASAADAKPPAANAQE